MSVSVFHALLIHDGAALANKNGVD
jgi:hypothetical protein